MERIGARDEEEEARRLPETHIRKERLKTSNSALRFVAIKDPDDPRLAAYNSLKGKSLERDGIFIAE